MENAGERAAYGADAGRRKEIYEDTQKQRGTGKPRAVVLMVQICTAYPGATGNGSGSTGEHLTQSGFGAL